MLTSSMSRLSYARILVELDLRADLPQSVALCLPNGITLDQQIVYETLPKFCKHCNVLGHVIATCSKISLAKGKSAGLENVSVSVEDILAGVMNDIISKGPMQVSRLQPLIGNDSIRDDVDDLLIDPMLAEASVVTGEWEMVKKKNQSNRHSQQNLAAGGVAVGGSVGLELETTTGLTSEVVGGLSAEIDLGSLVAGASGVKSVTISADPPPKLVSR